MYHITCPSCGRLTTRSSCPEWWNQNVRARCTARLSSGPGYQKGCGYEQASLQERKQADRFINSAR
ncbi:hypothetical protein [Neptuniibacter halophilus]|uniref:hypothetical protein n=1 Tax=Neptuniibacter halophilus TaxID=651666 RepID=UPI0025745611|nr:hypothetical protein [Neptuniibacter halophilus]